MILGPVKNNMTVLHLIFGPSYFLTGPKPIENGNKYMAHPENEYLEIVIRVY
jgi:hypothetical protein